MAAIRPFEEPDREAVEARGWPVVEGWRTRPSCHLVATVGGKIVGAAQAVASARTAGRWDAILRTEEDEAGEALLAATADFAQTRGADRLTAAYVETDRDLGAFLLSRGFVPFERYLPSRLALADFEPARFDDALRRVADRGIRLLTYAELGDTPENRRRLYDLERATRAAQPFREAGAYVAPPLADWERELADANAERLFLAQAEDRLVGLVTGFGWCYTGVHPGWQGRGVATALKVRSLTAAKAAGLEAVETENHEDNAPMLAINRKLGFRPGPAEINGRLDLARSSPAKPFAPWPLSFPGTQRRRRKRRSP